jgi:hypothetical protein
VPTDSEIRALFRMFGKTVERGRMGSGKRLEEAPYGGT